MNHDKVSICKSPEGMLKQELVSYYGMSSAEADVLWERIFIFVKEHYRDSRFDNQIIRYAVSADEPAGKPIKYCKLIPVKITTIKPSDKKIKDRCGTAHLKEVLVVRFANEAYAQGGLLSQEDLAEILFIDTRTIKRTVARLKVKGMEVPTRGQIKDIGPSMSHKAKIVELALKGYSTTEISFKTRHCLSSIARYVDNFIKVVYLLDKVVDLVKISRITKISEKVAAEYRDLYLGYIKDHCLKEKIEELKGYISTKKGGQN